MSKVISKLVSDDNAMRGLIGLQVSYLRERYEVWDVLPEDDTIVLAANDSTDMQDDSYGRPHRLVPKTQSLRFRDSEGKPTNIWDEIVFEEGPAA